jgi:peptidoglycan/LPS O-acetylase OafA/YrhL
MVTSSMTEPKPYFLGLDGLRGIAAFAVMWLHELALFRPGEFPALPAFLAVDLFFMLSGFVIAYAYGQKLDRGLTWSRFMAARSIRLYPMLAVGTVLGVAVSVVKQSVHHIAIPEESLIYLIPALLLIPTGLLYTRDWFDGLAIYPFNPPMWSLLFEIIASAVYATRIRTMGLKLFVPALAVGAVLLAILTMCAGTLTGFGVAGWLGFAAGFLRVAVPFAIGAALYESRWYVRLPKIPVIVFLVALGALMLSPIGRHWWYDLSCLFLVFPALICLTANAAVSSRTAMLCATLGRLSYPVYLLHWPVSRIVGFVVKSLHPDPSTDLLIGASIAATIGASWILLKLYDEPVRATLCRWLIRSTAPALVAQASGAYARSTLH